MIRRLAFSVLTAGGAFAALMAMDPSLALMKRTCTDPSRMRESPGSGRAQLATCWMNGGETAFTAVLWLRLHSSNPRVMTGFSSLWSEEPSRPTRQGGAPVPPVLDMTEASGTRAWTFADPRYECPDALTNLWRYGCYVVNVETPCDLTLTIAGAERQVQASNGVVQAFNLLGSAADYVLAVAPSDPSAAYRVGFGVNPLVRFHSLYALMNDMGGDAVASGGEPLTPNITNEWAMCVAQGRLEGGMAVERLAQFSWTAETFPEGETTNAAVRAAFARDGRVTIYRMALGGVDKPADLYGFKVFPRWLTDDELRNVRDLDVFEMKRRGIPRWTEEVE